LCCPNFKREETLKRNIAVGSTNPVKLEAVKAGFRSIFPGDALEFVSLEAASGVSAQPMGDAETRQGAQNRALAARNAQPDADFWVGVEGGAEETPGSPRALLTFAWVVILARGRRGQARTAAFELPEAVADLVRGGLELGDADDLVFKTSNSKRRNGAVGLLTGDVITRAGLYTPAVQLALIPFIRPELYQAETPGTEDKP